ncbi:adenine phosphoribosyltransferase [Aurantibacter sp.]|uniref:adenine phosphoribosyltransferase n=1 Tax=Aurantibacter sp. TaxID=2807103 RepID=UPI0035C7E017
MKEIEYLIRDIKDFPKPGIVFKDITPLLANPEAVRFCVDEFALRIDNLRIDKIVAIEARGFFFGILLAQKLNIPFVPVRKSGKLPGKTISESYSLEYGQDRLEIHEDAISKGDLVLVHDDVLATGGTVNAVTKLINRLEGKVVAYNFLIEIEFLKGKEKLENVLLDSLFKY